VSRQVRSRIVTRCRVITRSVGMATTVIGCLALLGWLFGIPAFSSVFTGLASMNPTTGLCFVLAGVSLWLSQAADDQLWKLRVRRLDVSRVLSGAVALVGLLTLAEYFFPFNLGIDSIVLHKTLQATGDLFPGRMSGPTALGFLTLGLSGLWMSDQRPYPSQSLALLTSLNGFVACIGYLIGVRGLYELTPYRSMALPTAILFVALGAALLLSRPAAGFAGALTSENLGGVMARRILPLAIVVPTFLGWLRWRGESAGLYGSEAGVALRTVSEVITFTVFLWLGAVWLNRLDQEHRRGNRSNFDMAAIVASSDDAMFSLDLDANIMSWNRGAEKLFGYRSGEIIGKPISILIPLELQEEALGFLSEIRGGRLIIRDQIVRQHKDGTRLQVSLIVSPVRDLDGEIVGCSAIVHDISERENANQLLREQAQALASAQVFVHDMENRIVFWPKGAERIYGFTSEEALGAVSYELLKTKFPEPLQNIVRILYQVGTWEGEVTQMTREGREIVVSSAWVLHRNSQGVPVRILETNIDITARKQAEKKLQHSEEMFSKAFRSSPLSITMSTYEGGRYLDVNEAFLKMINRERRDVINHTADELGFFVQPSHRAEIIRRLAASGRVEGYQTQFRRSSGEIREADISAEMIHIDGVQCVLGITRDATETKRLEAQFLQAQKMEAVGRLAGGIAHDFNNILGVIIGYSDLSLDLCPPESRLGNHLQMIKKASLKAVALVRQLLAFSRMQVVFPKVLDLNELIGNMIEMLERMVGEDVKVLFRPRTPISGIRADPGQIEQILMNMAVNARDAMPNGGKIVIETGVAELDESFVSRHPGSKTGEYLVLAFSDTGCGMDESTKSKIFDPFFTTKGVGRGTGLGLSTVYGIVNQSGGCIFVYSEPGEGTTFKIYLPTVVDLAEPLATPNAEVRFPQGSETILIVEDDEPLQELIVTVLQDAGYQVMKAENVEKALAILQAPEPRIDLLLTDVVLPGKSGIDLVAMAAGARPNLRSLFMSGYAPELVALRGGPTRDAAFLEKPFTRSSLLMKVSATLHDAAAKAHS